MLARAGNLIYWTCSGLAVLFVLIFVYSAAETGGFSVLQLVISLIVAAVIWGIGRGARYLFSGN